MYFSHGTDLWNKTEQTICCVPQRWWFILNRWRGIAARSGRQAVHTADSHARCRHSIPEIRVYTVWMVVFLSLGDFRGGYLLPAGHPRSPPGRPHPPLAVDIIWLRSAIVTIMQSFDRVMSSFRRWIPQKTENNICYARFYQYVIELTSFCNQEFKISASSNSTLQLTMPFLHTYLSITNSHT